MYCFKLVNLDPARLDKIKWILASGIINKDVWLAGGSLRTLIDPKDEVIDYDLFFKDTGRKGRNEKNLAFTKVFLDNLRFNCTFECPEGKLYTYEKKESINQFVQAYKVQLICENFYESPEHLLSTFDLSPTYFCTDGEFLWTNKLAIKSVKNKFCELLYLTYPVSTIKRLIKYSNKGYNINSAVQGVVSNLINKKSIITNEEMRFYID